MFWRAPGRRSAFVMALRYLGWLFRFPVNITRSIAAEGEMTRRQAGRSYSGQIADMVKVALANGVMPRRYYDAGMARDEVDEAAGYVPPGLSRM